MFDQNNSKWENITDSILSPLENKFQVLVKQKIKERCSRDNEKKQVRELVNILKKEIKSKDKSRRYSSAKIQTLLMMAYRMNHDAKYKESLLLNTDSKISGEIRYFMKVTKNIIGNSLLNNRNNIG